MGKSSILISVGVVLLVCGLYQHSKLNELDRLAIRSAESRQQIAIDFGDSRPESFRGARLTDKTPVYLAYGLGGIFIALGIAVYSNVAGSQPNTPKFQIKARGTEQVGNVWADVGIPIGVAIGIVFLVFFILTVSQ